MYTPLVTRDYVLGKRVSCAFGCFLYTRVYTVIDNFGGGSALSFVEHFAIKTINLLADRCTCNLKYVRLCRVALV